ncbi:hypothetical protein BCR35DRAFT_352212 [Leucosporidium creatinivorum]|uniref:Uncharacterized protein n=1 Tax=Leucosporidium creatinivorum TaxID=106004 RepID=A0A1Y2FGF9_9BASI|nr:hypothetical protein BCR35DRAFT_352212 [Leucosporidium creatinivorum]
MDHNSETTLNQIRQMEQAAPLNSTTGEAFVLHLSLVVFFFIVSLAGSIIIIPALLLFGTILIAGFAVIILGLAAPAAILARLALDGLRLPAYPPGWYGGVLVTYFLYPWDLYTKFVLPGVAILVGIAILFKLRNVLNRILGKEGDMEPSSEGQDLCQMLQILGFGLAAALCWYNRLSRAQNEGQLPVINSFLSLGCIACLVVLLTNIRNRLVAAPVVAERAPLVPEEKVETTGYGAAEQAEAVMEKLKAESVISAML